MLDCSLHYPDQVWWADEDDYHTPVATALTNAYITIGKGEGAVGYQQAMRYVEHLRDTKMSRRQRMHIFYLIALANDAIGDSATGLDWLDQALPLAFELESDFDISELLYRRANMNRAQLFLARAAEDARDSLLVIEKHEAELDIPDANAARIQILPQLATYEFYITDFDAAQEHIAQARKLIAQTANMSLPAATTEWVQVNLDILQHRPELAIRTSLQICDIYARDGNSLSYERAEILAAQAALAFAQSLPAGTYRDSALEMAFPHITTAEHLATTIHDQPGLALSQLMHTHYDRLANRNLDRIHAITQVIQVADDIYDIAISAQAHTLLGEEFATGGEIEKAYGCYRAVLDLVSESEIPALGIAARRALSEQSEFSL